MIEQQDGNLWVATVGDIEINIGDSPDDAQSKINRRLAELWERYVIGRGRDTQICRSIRESLLELVCPEAVE